jgi:hypothetical protein
VSGGAVTLRLVIAALIYLALVIPSLGQTAAPTPEPEPTVAPQEVGLDADWHEDVTARVRNGYTFRRGAASRLVIFPGPRNLLDGATWRRIRLDSLIDGTDRRWRFLPWDIRMLRLRRILAVRATWGMDVRRGVRAAGR